MRAWANGTEAGGARKLAVSKRAVSTPVNPISAVWVPVVLALLAAPALEGCSKRRLARAAPVTVPATSMASTALMETTVISGAGISGAGISGPGTAAADDLSAHAAEAEEGDESSAFAAITPGAVGPGDHPGPHAGATGLSGDDLPGRLADMVGAGSAQSVLERIAEAGDMRVFFSTNSIDRGLTAHRVQPTGTSRSAAVDAVCRQAGLSCFYAADFKSLSVYDPREFASTGPDMTALVYNRKQGYSEAPARNVGAAAPARNAAPSKPRKPTATVATTARPSPSRKPGAKAKPDAVLSAAKPAVKPAVKPKPTEASADTPMPGVKPKV
ncbi:hypothetical protein L2U69_12150 [Zavarzinia compransoris]|uniref:hypothetical protein n=1 Tax=Zavarzinia marina TaxID=2911065 RepID=UPI001F2827B8|nr:hypothetical protein [Zavarzinia marina]MCF4166397.1 hypothetical protein [Zavarzinia marina]